jgi:hypothetical protein
MEDYIQEALQQGFISRFTSPASAGFVFVAMKEGGLRTCIDYLRSAYNLICIREGDEWKTVFSMMSGHYKYLVMLI